MTEEEAKTKWCSFARVATLAGNAVGNIGADTKTRQMIPLAHCIGSDCMAWRVHPDRSEDSGEGYCGLAGKP